MKKLFWVIFVLCFAVGLFFFFSARGANTDIVINEIGAYEASGYEWVEIYNHGAEDVDLSDWKFWEGGANHGITPVQGDFILSSHEFALIVQDDKKFLEKYSLVTSTIFDSSWGTLNENGEEIGIKDNLGNFVERFVYSVAENFSLERKNVAIQDYTENNWAEHIDGNTAGQRNFVEVEEIVQEVARDVLLEEVQEEENIVPQAIFQISSSSVKINTKVDFDASGSIDSDGTVDTFEWIFGDGTVGEGKQTSHVYTTTGTFFVELVVADDKIGVGSTSTTLFVTEEGKKSIPLEKETLVINEFVFDPEVGEEWIELYNYGTTTVDLSNIIISDGAGVIAEASSTIESSDFFVIKLSSNKLNNTGDTIILTNNREELLDQVTYGNWDDGNVLDNVSLPKKGNSVARAAVNGDGQYFYETEILTQGSANTIFMSPPAVVSPVSVKKNLSPVSLKTNVGSAQPSFTQNKKYRPGDVIINEFVSDPADEAEEFIEFFNASEYEIDLFGWYVADGSGVKSFLQGKIQSKKYFVFEKPKGSLNNSGDTIILFDPNLQKIDQVTYGNWDDGNILDNAVVGASSQSLSRIPNGVDTNDDYKDFRVTEKISSGRENIFEELEPVVYKNLNIVINEVLPNPVGQDENVEFIELYNAGEFFVDLVGWKLKDTKNTYTITKSQIGSGEYIAFLGAITGISLNNSGDEQIELVSPGGTIVSTLMYKDALEGKSYARKDDVIFEWTASPTLAKKNIFELSLAFVDEKEKNSTKNILVDSKEPAKKILKEIKKPSTSKKKIKKTNQIFTTNLEQLREYDIGTRVKVSGIVTVLPGVFGSQYFYIGSTSGVQIYMNRKDFPDLLLGDKVEIVGEIAEAYGETRLKVSLKKDITVIDHPGELSAQEIEVAQLGELVEGRLVQIHGDVTEIKSSYMYVDDGSAEVKVYFKAGANIEKLKIKVGDEVKVAGIVTQTNAFYQLLPRANSDIVILKTTPIFTEKIQESNTSKYISILAGFLVTLAIFWRLFGNRVLKFLQK